MCTAANAAVQRVGDARSRGQAREQQHRALPVYIGSGPLVPLRAPSGHWRHVLLDVAWHGHCAGSGWLPRALPHRARSGYSGGSAYRMVGRVAATKARGAVNPARRSVRAARLHRPQQGGQHRPAVRSKIRRRCQRSQRRWQVGARLV